MGTTVMIVGLVCIVIGIGYALFGRADSPFNPELEVPEYTSKIEAMIESGGYVWQHKLWRRWIMAQMMRKLTYGGTRPMDLKNYKKSLEWLEWYGASRCAHVCGREKLMQRMLQKAHDQEELQERQRWYTAEVLAMSFRYGQPVPEPFKNAYKGTGAYFTMKNLVMFHGCRFHVGGQVLGQDASLQYLKELNFMPSTTGDMMLETMMKLLSDNHYTYASYQRAIAKRG